MTHLSHPDESSATLRSTTTLYDRYSSLLTTSSRLVHQIEQADWYDRLIIFSALAFFLLVVAFIVKRRVLDKAVHGVGWWVGGSWRLVTGQWRQSPKEVVKGVVGIKSGKDLLPVVTEAAATAVRTLASEQKGDQMETLESALRQHHEL
jgi:protein transport protein SEC20